MSYFYNYRATQQFIVTRGHNILEVNVFYMTSSITKKKTVGSAPHGLKIRMLLQQKDSAA